MKDKNLYNCWM